MTLRRLLLLFLVALTACTAFERYQWEVDPISPPCQSVVWKQVARDRVPGLCGNAKRAAAAHTSCALSCVIVSPYSEAQAHSIFLPDGDSLWTHEVVKHALGGLKHP
jgi:hypothetical protein